MLSKNVFRLAATGVLVAGVLSGAPGTAGAANGDCSQPQSSGDSPVASDCLYILRTAVGTVTPPKPCITRPKHGTSTKASDALVCLSFSVGADVAIDCPCGDPDVQSSVYTFDPDVDMPDSSAAVRAKFVKTDYYGAFSQDQDSSAGDWTADWTVRLHGNHKVWEPAGVGVGTLNGATPTATDTCPAGTTHTPSDKKVLSTGMGFTGEMDVCDLPNRFSSAGTLALTNDNIYRVNTTNPGTLIGDGDGQDKNFANSVHSTLSIEPGTLFVGSNQKAIIVTRGSQIQAVGTASDPIVMDSENSVDLWIGGNDDGGLQRDWGGLVVTGSGTVNKCNDLVFCDNQVEGVTTTVLYGGFDTNVDCGTLQYLVIAHSGSLDAGGFDLNGLTTYACNTPTDISYIDVDKGGDDAFEFFGGDVVADHLVATNNFDDNFDTDLGYRGGVQFMVIAQASTNTEGDKGFEWDNGCTAAPCTDGGANTNTPRTLPTAANVTIMMNPNTTTADSTGMGFRSATGGNVWNVIETNGKHSAIRTQAFSGLATATASQGRVSDKLSVNNVWQYNPLMIADSGTAQLSILRGADATDANDLVAIFNAGTNNILKNTDPMLNTVAGDPPIGYPQQ